MTPPEVPTPKVYPEKNHNNSRIVFICGLRTAVIFAAQFHASSLNKHERAAYAALFVIDSASIAIINGSSVIYIRSCSVWVNIFSAYIKRAIAGVPGVPD